MILKEAEPGKIKSRGYIVKGIKREIAI